MKTPPTTMSTCGTKEGYMAHQRRKQEACKECKAAWSYFYRDYRAGRKQKNL